MELALIISNAEKVITDLIAERCNQYSDTYPNCRLLYVRRENKALSVAWALDGLPESQPLRMSRLFYRIFSTMTGRNSPAVKAAFDVRFTDVFTVFPATTLRQFGKLHNFSLSIREERLLQGAPAIQRLHLNWTGAGGLKNEVVFLHCVLLMLASISTPHQLRTEVVKQELTHAGASSLLDLGCGTGGFLVDAYTDCGLQQIGGIEQSYRDVKKAQRRARFHAIRKDHSLIFQARLETLDERFKIYEAVTMIEVIEHIALKNDNFLLFEEALFGRVNPRHIILTTPDRDFNRYLKMPGAFRLPEHTFEWSAAEFETWARQICLRYSYTVVIKPVGGLIAKNGACVSQMAIFSAIGSPTPTP
jgi:hypothetical protein